MKYFLLIILLVTQVFAAGKIQNEDVKSLTELTAAGGGVTQLINDTKVYVTANGYNDQLSNVLTNSVVPLSTLGSGDISYSKTFNLNFSGIPLTHVGTTATIGVIPVGNGGTGLSTPGTSGNVLTSNGTSWVSSASATSPSGSTQIENVGVASSVASNALTVAIKQADGSTNCSSGSGVCSISFRGTTSATGSFVKRQLAASSSLTVASGATLGTLTGGAPYTIYFYAIDNAGTIEPAISSQQYDDGSILSTTALSGSSNSPNVLYSTTARTNVAIRLIARITITESTAGTWASNATEIAAQPFFKGEVTAGGIGAFPKLRIESAEVNSGCSTAFSRTTSTWVGAASSAGAGQCSITINSGVFSSTPFCFVTGAGTSANTGELAVAYVSLSNTNFTYYMSQPGVGGVNRLSQILCIGSR